MFVSSALAATTSITLRAEPGHFNAQVLGKPDKSLAIRGTLRITAFNSTRAWPTAAYIRIQEGSNRNNSVQVVLIRNRESDPYLVVGYRLIVDGKEVKVGAIETVAVPMTVRIGMAFKDGVATISVDDTAPIEVPTSFREMAPYLSVSSGEAQFETALSL